jgi:hypothetical protein
MQQSSNALNIGKNAYCFAVCMEKVEISGVQLIN